MKELSTYNRVAGYLNRIFDLLNQEFFESTLSRPTITIQSTPRAYGHFSLRDDTWISKKGATHEINIGAGTLSRPIEEVCATLLHEMVHYHNYVLGIQDCSRGGTYHNRRFRDSAEAHGLIVNHHEKYGWTITSPSDRLLQFCLDNDLSDILINRNEYGATESQARVHTPLLRHQWSPRPVPPGSISAPAAVILSGLPKWSTSAVWTAQSKWFWQDKGGNTMYVLDKLWRGTLSPSEQCVNHGSEYSQLHHKAAQMGSQILSKMSDGEKQLFQEYQELRERMSYISEEDMFVNGFRIGVGLILDAIGTYESQFVRYHEDN